jgi:hypothetical protein
MAAGYVLSALIALFYIWLLPGLASLSGSDAAGNALSQAYAAIITIVLWGLLALLAFIAWIKGDMPWPAALAALILIPVSGIVALMAGDLLASPRMSPYLWPIIIPAAIPPLIVAFSLWALVPALRGAVAAPVAAGTTLGATLILCAAIVPLEEMRRIVIERDSLRAKNTMRISRGCRSTRRFGITRLSSTRRTTPRKPRCSTASGNSIIGRATPSSCSIAAIFRSATLGGSISTRRRRFARRRARYCADASSGWCSRRRSPNHIRKSSGTCRTRWPR